MNILCLGVNHKTAPVEIRERLAFVDKQLPDDLRAMRELSGIGEMAVLSTCNRVEIYATAENAQSAIGDLTNYLIQHFEIDDPAAIEFYEIEGEAAARHLFHVASGLDSMVLGETEIFGQVKKAYATAQSAGTTSRQLNKLFQQSFRIGKLVRSSTKIQQGSTSIGAVAVDLAEGIFGNLKGCKIMIIGAGEMSRTTAQSLVSRGASSIFVSNRSYEKAVILANELEGKAVRFDDWESNLSDVDIIITATGAPHTILKTEIVRDVMDHRRGRMLFIIDIAVPRDVDDEVNEIESVYLYNIDEMQRVAAEGRSKRQEQIAICTAVIEKHLKEKGIGALESAAPISNERSENAGGAEPIAN